MMPSKKFINMIFVFLLVGCWVGMLQAELVEIPLPDLHGEYPLDEIGSYAFADFSFNMDPSNVDGASIRFSGVQTNGLVDCGYPPPPTPWSVAFYAHIQDEYFDELWYGSAEFFMESGSYSLTFELNSSIHSSPTWHTLGDGTGTVEFMGFPLATWCDALEFPSATVEDVVIIFDMSSTVPAESVRWGQIKALFMD